VISGLFKVRCCVDLNLQQALWGLIAAGIMYVIGNGAWVNHLARRKIWVGWALWLAAGVIIILMGSLFEARLDGETTGIFQRLAAHPNGTPVDLENHWIILLLFALMSVPGAASIMFGQSILWTRIALVFPALIVFIPAGMEITSPDGNKILAGIGTGLTVAGFMVIWQMLLDRETEA